MLVDVLATLQNSIVFQAALVYFAAYPIVTSILWVTTSLMFRLRWEPRIDEVAQPAGPLPAVSVLVPAHNEEAVIVRSVRAMLAMDYPDFEVIVVDDGSTDDTAGALGRLAGNPRLRIVRKVVNEGKAMALNDALPLARGEIVLILDADAEPAPDLLRWMVPALRRAARRRRHGQPARAQHRHLPRAAAVDRVLVDHQPAAPLAARSGGGSSPSRAWSPRSAAARCSTSAASAPRCRPRTSSSPGSCRRSSTTCATSRAPCAG